MQNTREKMNFMHKNDVDIVGEVGTKGLAIENGKLWPKHVSSENSVSIEITLGTA